MTFHIPAVPRIVAFLAVLALILCGVPAQSTPAKSTSVQGASDQNNQTFEQKGSLQGIPAAPPALEPIRIGVYQPLSGENAFPGQMEVSGIQLAHAEQPTMLGRPVELIILDNKFDRVEAASAVKLLTTEHQVLAILGSYGSSVSLAGGEVAERARIPVLGPSPTSTLVTQGRHFYFRVGFTDPQQGIAAGTYAAEKGLRRAAILVDGKSDHALGLATYFRRAFIKGGGEVVAEVRYEAGNRDFIRALNQFITKRADVVYMPAFYEDGVAILKDAQELGASYLLLGSDPMDTPQLETRLGKGVFRFQCTSFPFEPESPDIITTQFVAAWKKRYPGVRVCTSGALGFTAYMMLHEAVTRAGKADGEAVATALARVNRFPSLFGGLTMNQTHDTNMPVGILEYTSGERKLAKIYP